MKKAYLLVAAMLFCSFVLHAQAPLLPTYRLDTLARLPGATMEQILDSAYAHIDPNDTAEGGGIDRFKAFSNFWKCRGVVNDSTGHNMFAEYYHEMGKVIAERNSSPGCGDNANWQQTGPMSLPDEYMGKINSIWADPSDSTYILAGASGGLFKTINGQPWHCITDKAMIAGGVIGLNSIAVNPLNKNTIFLGTGVTDEENLVDLMTVGYGGYGAGILESFDGGNTWTQEFLGTDYNDTIGAIQKVFFTPDSLRIYAFRGNQVWTRTNGNPIGTWVNITPQNTSNNATWTDLQFLPGNQNTFFISNVFTNVTEAGIYMSNNFAVPDVTHPYTEISVTIPNETYYYYDPQTGALVDTFHRDGNGYIRMAISVPSSDTLVAVCMIGPHSMAALFKYDLTNQQWHLRTLPLSTGDNSSQNKLVVIASPQNPKNIYYASATPFMSCDGGTTDTEISPYGGTNGHADIRGMWLQNATNTLNGIGDRLYICSDGGVSKKPAGYNSMLLGDLTTKNMNGEGLTCGELWGIGMSWNGHLIDGGEQHDGSIIYEKGATPAWTDLMVGDGTTSDFDEHRSSAVIFSYTMNPNITVPYGGRQLGATEPEDSIPDYSNDIQLALWVDGDGNQYAGYHNLWELSPPLYSMWNNRGADLHLSNPNNTLIRRIVFSKYFTETGYVLFEKDAVEQRLEYRNPNINNFFNLSNAVPGPFQVTDITMDSYNPDRVWVCNGGISGSQELITIYRAQYSPDHGQTWIDISNGLPRRTPISRIVYDEARNSLYCATDAGIYYCDFNNYNPSSTVAIDNGTIQQNTSVHWECFSNALTPGSGFPNVFVTELKRNYCQNKLYAATYGRGLWSSDIADPWNIATRGLDITSNTTWNTNKYITAGITVEPGATLTVQNDTVHMPGNGVITVKPGGKLVVDHAVITNDCVECMWFGIEVLGNPGAPQSPASNQGWVVFKNNSVISHARYAVSNYDLWNGDLNTTGGIIQATNTNFVNNHRGATFAKYHNYHSGFLYPNVSSFLNDSFFLDNDYRGDPSYYAFTSHIFMEEVEGISVRGVNFINRNSNNLNRGDGIASHNAGFSVANSCPSLGILNLCMVPYLPCYFNGFANGIYISKDISLDPTITINNAHFDSVSVGIDINGANSVSALNNVFTVGHGLYTYEGSTYGDCFQNIGILTNNANSFHIEGNAFTGIATGGSPTLTNIGVAVENSGINDKRVQGNTFTTLDIGCYAYGKNGLRTPYVSLIFSGLEYRCNTYSSNANGILVNVSNDSDGISPHQGNGDTAAGNTFTPHLTSSCANGGHLIYYNYNGTNSYPATFSGSVTPEPDLHANLCGNSLIYHNNTYANGTIDVGAYNALKTAHAGLTTALSDSSNAYNSIIDEGNTTHVLGLISGVLTTGYTQLYDTLAKISPFLSPQVLYAALIDSTVFSKSQRWNLWNSNHEAATYLPVDPAYSSFSGSDSAAYYSSTTLAYSHLTSGNITRRHALDVTIVDEEDRIAEYGSLMLLASKSPIDTAFSVTDTTSVRLCGDSTSVYYRLDSNSRYFYLDSVGSLLNSINEKWAQYDLVGYYRFNNNSTAAASVMTNLSRKGYADYDDAEHTGYNEIITLLDTIAADGRTIDSLTEDEYESFSAYGAPPSAAKNIQIANNVLTWTNVSIHLNPCLLMSTVSPKHNGNGNSNNNNNNTWPGSDRNGNFTMNSLQENNILTAFPNPGKEKVTFNFNAPDASGDLSLIIMNIAGGKVKTFRLIGKTGSVTWFTGPTISGTYIYQLRDDKGAIANGKIILER